MASSSPPLAALLTLASGDTLRPSSNVRRGGRRAGGRAGELKNAILVLRLTIQHAAKFPVLQKFAVSYIKPLIPHLRLYIDVGPVKTCPLQFFCGVHKFMRHLGERPTLLRVLVSRDPMLSGCFQSIPHLNQLHGEW